MIKICGITLLPDAMAAIDCGADALGFVLARGPRRISLDVAGEIVSRLPSGVLKIGVFADEPLDSVRKAAGICGFDLVQLHGSEDASYVAGLGCMAMKSVFPAGTRIKPDPGAYPGLLLLLDAPRDEGGMKTCERCDWGLAARLAAERPVLVGGGLDPDNVEEAIRAVRPLGVDVCSGVESSPGRKDRGKLALFIERARKGLEDA